MYFKRGLLGVLLALCLAGVCDAIRCYECQSTQDSEHCGEKFSDSGNIRKIDCDSKQLQGFSTAHIQKPTKCSKTIIEDKIGKVVIRGCHFQTVNSNSNCPLDTPPGSYCETCTYDLCNGVASTPLIALGTILLVVTSVLFMM